jgi:glycine betaine/proline transport system substrate-binding protein
MIGKYAMVPVDMGTWAGDENWDGCIVKAEQDCADPKPSSWTHSEVHTVMTSEFAGRGGHAVDYLKNRIFPGPIMNGMLVYMGDEQAGGEDAAIHFLKTHEDLWTGWVSNDAAAKIKSSL